MFLHYESTCGCFFNFPVLCFLVLQCLTVALDNGCLCILCDGFEADHSALFILQALSVSIISHMENKSGALFTHLDPGKNTIKSPISQELPTFPVSAVESEQNIA